MSEKNALKPHKFDTRELELPETLFVRDIENRVFQSIVLQCLAKIEGIGLMEGSFIDNVLGRAGTDSVKGIYAEQDNKNHSVGIKVEIKVAYGIIIPKKAEEIQTEISKEITRLTGLHVSFVHVVFKNILQTSTNKKLPPQNDSHFSLSIEKENENRNYSEEF